MTSGRVVTVGYQNNSTQGTDQMTNTITTTLTAVKDMIRAPYAWPGAYSKTLLMSDGECLCGKCVKSEFKAIVQSTIQSGHGWPVDGWTAETAFIHWEGEPIVCAHCNADIDSVYGVPDS